MLKRLGLVFSIGYSCFFFPLAMDAADVERPLPRFSKPFKQGLLVDRNWKHLLMRELTLLEGNGAISLEEWKELEELIRNRVEGAEEDFLMTKLEEIRKRPKLLFNRAKRLDKRAKIKPSPQIFKHPEE